MKICPVVAEMLHADRLNDGRTDRRTDMTKLIMTFAILRKRLKTVKFKEGKVKYKNGGVLL